MLFHSILVQIRNYGDIHTIVLMLVFHFLSVLSFTFFSNYVFTWELELVGRVFVKAEVLGNVVEGVKIHLVEKDKEPKIMGGRKTIRNK